MNLFLASPSAIVSQRYDRLTIVCFGIVWAVYAYLPHVATRFLRPEEQPPPGDIRWLWAPACAVTLIYICFPIILRLDKLWKIFTFISVGLAMYLAHVGVAGFGIIDLSWFGFYYGSLGMILLLWNSPDKPDDSVRFV